MKLKHKDRPHRRALTFEQLDARIAVEALGMAGTVAGGAGRLEEVLMSPHGPVLRRKRARK